MNGIRLHNLEMLHLLWMIPLFVAFLVYASRRRRAAMAEFVRPALLKRFPVAVSPVKRVWKAIFFLLAVALVIVALVRPVWNLTKTSIKRQGRDVVFVLDVSRSMLAEDLAPNRMERAKLAVRDCVEHLRGDRVALVAFAGTAVVKCPLTLDYGFFRLMLDNIVPGSINRGGTMIGDAVRTVLDQVFDKQEKQYRDIVLITDGEDHESFPVEAAKAAGDLGVRLITVGLGDEHEGRRIPIAGPDGKRTFLKYKGREVWTKLDADTLRRMANRTPGGVYLPVSTGAIDLGEVYDELIAGAAKREFDTKIIKQYEEKFQIFLAAAFLLLCLEVVISEDRRLKAEG